MDKQTEKELLEVVKKNYDQIADQYNETRKKHISPLWDELSEITKEVSPGKKILDLGCGNGRLLDFFKDKQIEYLGVDTSKELLKHAQENHPGYKFKEGNLLELGKVSEIDFDYVFSIAVLHHIPGLNLRVQVLRQIRNKVKENGKVIITVWNLWNIEKCRKKIVKNILLKIIGKNLMDIGDIRYDWKNSEGDRVSERYYHAFTKGELKKIAKKAGFKKIKIKKDNYNYYLILKK